MGNGGSASKSGPRRPIGRRTNRSGPNARSRCQNSTPKGCRFASSWGSHTATPSYDPRPTNGTAATAPRPKTNSCSFRTTPRRRLPQASHSSGSRAPRAPSRCSTPPPPDPHPADRTQKAIRHRRRNNEPHPPPQHQTSPTNKPQQQRRPRTCHKYCRKANSQVALPRRNG